MKKYESFQTDFLYIKDEKLKTHMIDTLDFITSIVFLLKKFPEEERHYFRKTIILYIASIVEANIHYCLIELGIYNYKVKTKEFKIEKKIGNYKGKLIVAGENKEININLKSGKVSLDTLNKCAKTQNIYNDYIFKKVDKIRNLRNQIHLVKLNEKNRNYSTIMLEECFETAYLICNIVEDKLL